MVKKAQKVNDLIFKELIKRGYSLEGNTRIWNIADSKLWYLTPEQAQAFLDLERSEDYQKDVIQKEIDLINTHIDSIVTKIGKKPVNIIDLGCGDGKKALMFINKIGKEVKVRYCPIDISSYMVETALENIQKSDVEEVVKIQWNISDFENIENVSSLLRYKDFNRNVFLLLGNTIGNFEINELLYEVRSGMKEGDLLIIGNGLDNRNPDEIMKSYSNDLVNRFLINIPLQIGLEKKDIKFGARFANSRVEVYYTLLNDKTILFQGKEVRFNKGDQIIVAVSYKYDKKEFVAFLKMYFNEAEVFVAKDESYAIALCEK